MDFIDAINREFKLCFSKNQTLLSAETTNDIDDAVQESIKNRIPRYLNDYLSDSTYKVKGSVGVGSATKTPWIAILNRNITDTTREGVYIVFLFSSDCKNVYLTLNQGTTQPKQFGRRLGIGEVTRKSQDIRAFLNINNPLLQIDGKADIYDKKYKAGAIYYTLWDVNDKNSCKELIDLYLDIYKQYETMTTSPTKNTIMPEAHQIIYYGAPGTGKSHEVKKQTGELLDDGKEVDLPNVFRTTFHPDTDYAAFVGCYKPAMRPTSKEEKTLTGKDEEIAYTFVPQVFTDAYVYAYSNPTEQTYLVIEEINRGNCAQIFGDLFQLLDRKDGKSEYKIKADKDLAKYLADTLGVDSEGIKDGKLCLPANLHILATMNTSDQSLFPMDSAFKRRWEWEYVPINYGTDVQSGEFEITIDKKNYSWVQFIEKVNEKIFALTQSEDKQMGNFFIKHSIDDKGFKSKVMFYLWYEVLRDETENNKYFFYGKTTIDGKEVLSKFTFKDLYTDKATETLQQFMEYLGVASK